MEQTMIQASTKYIFQDGVMDHAKVTIREYITWLDPGTGRQRHRAGAVLARYQLRRADGGTVICNGKGLEPVRVGISLESTINALLKEWKQAA